jgi:hypothetical protein
MTENFRGPEEPQNPQEKRIEDDKETIVLPDHEEMITRLIKVDDNPHLQERFYPILLKAAGQKRVPQGIVMMLALAIHDYTEGMPPMMASLMYMKAPDFIDALINDTVVAEETKKLLQSALSGSN